MKKNVLFLFLLSLSINMAGQGGGPDLKNVVPPSPTAASLGKYGEIPVSLYTGTPNISIPLYEISDGPLTVPISLSYHAAGIRVEEIASEVGLGWTLNAGGAINKQIRGNDDDTGWVTSSPGLIRDIIQSGNSTNISLLKQELQLGARDGEADIYSYNFNGRSGRFLFDEDGTLYNYPAENVSVTPLAGTHSFGSGWKVVAEDGTVYEFDASELVYSSPCVGSGTRENYTAWYLTKIKSADGKRQIDFIYDSISYSVQMPMGATRKVYVSGSNCTPSYDDCTSSNTYYTKRLSQISFSGGFVDFDYNTGRQDLPGTNRLDAIKVYSTGTGGNQLVKEYQLGFGYFGASGSTYEKRLKLTSVTENPSNGSKPPYLFTYNETIQMPSRFSPDKDHWGYFNDAGNTTTIPNTSSVYGTGYQGADRDANASTMQACILKKITYPTGGETLFTYETNQSTDPRISAATYTETPYHLYLDQLWSTLTSPYETGTFTVPTGDEVEVAFSMEGLEDSGSVYNCDAFTWYLLKDGVPTSYLGSDDSLDGVTLDLDPGTYKFRIVFDCYNPSGRLDYDIVATVRVPVQSQGTILRYVGGLRIKQIEDKPANGGQSVIKNYSYPSGGLLVNFPDYGYELTYTDSYMSGGWCYAGGTCNYYVLTSSTNYPLATTGGSYVGYSKVVEDLGALGEVEHIYQAYTTPGGEFPFAPVEMWDWQRGKELQTNYYSIVNGVRVPKKEVVYSYTGVAAGTITGYKSSNNHSFGSCFPPSQPISPYMTYEVLPQFYYLSGVRERNYDQNDPSKWVETSTLYKYDSGHYQQTEVVSSVSSDDDVIREQLVVKRKFPGDYNTANASGSEALGIKKLNDLHVVNAPIEEYTLRQTVNTSNAQVSNERVVSGVITTYKTNDPYPDKLLRLEKSNVMSLANFGTGSTISNNVFVKNANATINSSYVPAIEFTSYDSYGNLTTQRRTDGTYVSYLWGYNGQYPVAKVENATATSVEATLTSTELTNIRNGSYDQSTMLSKLDKIRAGLPGAMVTTYTYDPLVGVTSMTDPKGYTVYYEYDGFNRLSQVKDAAGNILSVNEYHYKNQ